MSRFIYFLQVKGIWVCAAHLGVGIFVTCVVTVIGYAFDKFQIGYAARLFLWQSHLLWFLVRSSFLEGYENGLPVYAGYPFMIIWFTGILSGIPIYTLLSMLIHYVWSGSFRES